jgi:3-hydroxyisobutyrate dehydrogenase
MANDLPSIVFIGVGNMGAPMASRLIEAGHPLGVVDRSPAALEAFRLRGIPTAANASELDGEVAITMLPTDAHVREALLGSGGALARERRAVIEMSSSRPSATLALAAVLAEKKIALLDAPVSGGVPRAKTGELITMVGGSEDDVERYRPLLGAMCKTITHVGAIGAGHTMKALNNYLSSVALWASAEALLIGARAGLDPATMIDVWSKGTAASHAVQVKIPMAMLPRTFDYGFTLGLLAKDLDIAAGIARDLDVPVPMIATNERNWQLAKHELGANADYTSIIRLLERWSGFELPAAVPIADSPRP